MVLEKYIRLRVGEGGVERAARELAKVAARGCAGKMDVRENGGCVVLSAWRTLRGGAGGSQEVGSGGESENTGQRRVEHYVDLSARLNALLALERGLLQMLKRARTIENILKVEEHLPRVRAQIEAYTAQLKNLERMIQYSTLYVHMEAPAEGSENRCAIPEL